MPAGNAAVTLSRKATLVRKAHKEKETGTRLSRPGADAVASPWRAGSSPSPRSRRRTSAPWSATRCRPADRRDRLRRPRRTRLRVLVIGCIHGDETAGMRVTRRLIAAAAAAGRALGRPRLNPDGVAAGTRGNAHGVDLNRNFPFGWQPLGGLEYSGPARSRSPSRARRSA